MRERDKVRGLPQPEPSGVDDWRDLPTAADEPDPPMEAVDLILQLSVYERNAAGGEHILLFASLQSRIGRHRRQGPELLVLCRDGAGLPPPWITKSAVSRRDVDWLKTLLESYGFPRRTSRLFSTPGWGSTRGRLWIELEVRLGDRASSLKLGLQPAGFSGPDARLIGAVLPRLGELAEAAGRPAVRALLQTLTGDRFGVDERGYSPALVPAGEAQVRPRDRRVRLPS